MTLADWLRTVADQIDQATVQGVTSASIDAHISGWDDYEQAVFMTGAVDNGPVATAKCPGENYAITLYLSAGEAP